MHIALVIRNTVTRYCLNGEQLPPKLHKKLCPLCVSMKFWKVQIGETNWLNQQHLVASYSVQSLCFTLLIQVLSCLRYIKSEQSKVFPRMVSVVTHMAYDPYGMDFSTAACKTIWKANKCSSPCILSSSHCGWLGNHTSKKYWPFSAWGQLLFFLHRNKNLHRQPLNLECKFCCKCKCAVQFSMHK